MSAFVSTTFSFNGIFTPSSTTSKCHPTKPALSTFSSQKIIPASTMTSPINTKTIVEEKTRVPSVSSIKTMEDFWKLADESNTFAQYDADSAIEFLKEANLEEIRSICLQYRYFVDRYPSNLARLLAKMPNLQLKSLLCSILSEEMGDGNVSGSHIVWYDRFLRSIGVTEEQMQNSLYEENEDILSEIEYRCNSKPFEHVVGMVGMAGECLCQIYLTAMYKNLLQNKTVKEMGKQIDWEFWTYHVGEADIEHRRMVRECINELVIGEDGVKELASGYVFGKNNWDQFWFNNFKNTRARQMV